MRPSSKGQVLDLHLLRRVSPIDELGGYLCRRHHAFVRHLLVRAIEDIESRHNDLIESSH